jgi:hypothetical protein
MSYSSSSPDEYRALFEACNRTELYQIARAAGFPVPPGSTRSELISIIIYEKECLNVPPDIDEWRRAIMRFLIDHRRVLETQITCPAKSFEEDACFTCIDTQVVHCLSSNGTENFKLIELRKKKKP